MNRLPKGKTAKQLMNELRPINDTMIHEALELAEESFSVECDADREMIGDDVDFGLDDIGNQ